MNRKEFITSSSLITLGSVLLPRSLTGSDHYRHTDSMPPGIVVPFCPGTIPINGQVAFMANNSDALMMSHFYRNWHKDLIYLSQGLTLSNYAQREIEYLRIKINPWPIVQINETPFGLTIDSTEDSITVDLLYWDYSGFEKRLIKEQHFSS